PKKTNFIRSPFLASRTPPGCFATKDSRLRPYHSADDRKGSQAISVRSIWIGTAKWIPTRVPVQGYWALNLFFDKVPALIGLIGIALDTLAPSELAETLLIWLLC